jgi:hypothetical protein
LAVRLRPHHLLCVLTYVGKGYSRDFVENFDRLAERLSAGEAVEIVSGPDDICRPLMGGGCHCLEASPHRRDRIAARLIGMVANVTVEAGAPLQLSPALVGALREAFTDGRLRGACDGCEWFDLCSEVAASGYAGCRVMASDEPQAACS